MSKLMNVGHHTRGPGIAAAEGQWVHCTNQDNQLMLGWLDQLYPYLIDDSVGLVSCEIVNNLWGWRPFDIKLKRGYVDLACVVVRSEIAKEIGFPFVNDYEGDGMWIEACTALCKKKKLRLVHIDRQLVTHN